MQKHAYVYIYVDTHTHANGSKLTIYTIKNGWFRIHKLFAVGHTQGPCYLLCGMIARDARDVQVNYNSGKWNQQYGNTEKYNLQMVDFSYLVSVLIYWQVILGLFNRLT